MMNKESPFCRDVNNIVDLRDNCVSDVLKLDNVLAAILKREKNVMDYIGRHFEEIADFAFGIKETKNDAIRKNAANIISTEIAVSCDQCIDLLLEKMGSIIGRNGPLTTPIADSLTTILTFLIKCTNCLILEELPNSNTLLQILLDNIQLPSVQNFLQFITSYGMERIINFFEYHDASELFLKKAIEDPIKADIYFGYILNLFNKIDVASPLVDIFSNEHMLNSIFTYGLESQTHYPLKIINKIIYFVKYEDRTMSDVASTVYAVSQNRVNELIEFITSNLILTPARAEAADIIIQLWNARLQISNAVKQVFVHFATMTKIQPVNTKAHYYLLEFTKIISQLPEFSELVNNCSLKENSQKAIKAKFHPNSGFYIRIALILPHDQKWDKFVKDYVNPRIDAASGSYGGNRPKMDSYELYDLIKEDQPGLQSAIEAACKLYGRERVLGNDFIDDFEEEEEYIDELAF